MIRRPSKPPSSSYSTGPSRRAAWAAMLGRGSRLASTPMPRPTGWSTSIGESWRKPGPHDLRADRECARPTPPGRVGPHVRASRLRRQKDDRPPRRRKTSGGIIAESPSGGVRPRRHNPRANGNTRDKFQFDPDIKNRRAHPLTSGRAVITRSLYLPDGPGPVHVWLTVTALDPSSPLGPRLREGIGPSPQNLRLDRSSSLDSEPSDRSARPPAPRRSGE